MIFVTGGTGLVGAHLLYDLVSCGETVRALKRPGSSIQRTKNIFSFYSPDYELLMQKIEWVEGDMLEKDSLPKLLAGVDQIYHSAAMVSFYSGDRELMIRNNVEGTANLVDLALSLKISRFCHVSSISAIGLPPEDVEANEDHPWRSNRDHSAYAQSKYLSEMEVWRACFQGLDVVIVNPSVILGPDNWNSGSSVMFKTVWKGLRFYTKGGTGFVDVRDVTAAMQHLMQDDTWEIVKNQRYILNAGNVPYREIFNQIADALHVKRPKFSVGKTLLKLACPLAALSGFFKGSRPAITREMIRSAIKLSYYDGAKICRATGFVYTPIRTTIQNISGLFLKDHQPKADATF